MPLDEKDKRVYINELQFLQKEINFLQKFLETNKVPSLDKTIETLRTSQDKLYGALSYHGVTAEEVYKVIMENSDKKLVSEVIRLQNAKDKISKKLSDPQNLTPKQIQLLEKSLARKTEEHTAKWDEITNSPNKKELINKIEKMQKNQPAKEIPEPEKEHDLEPAY